MALGWALYDFANTIFSYAVVSYAIGLWLTDEARFGPATGQLALSLAIFASVGLNALVSPLLGAISDRGGRRLPYLFAFTALCVVAIAFVGASPALVGVLLFVVANFAYQAALIYYDATLRDVARPEARGRLSGLGVGVGYLGTIVVGLLIFLLRLPVEAVFLVAAVLYALFAIPIFLVVRERGRTAVPTFADVTGSWRAVAATVARARQVPGLLRFIVARFLYTDAVNTVIVVMSVFAVEAIGVSQFDANLILLSLTVIAVVASIAWGLVVDRVGPKRTLVVVLGSWCVGLALAAASLGMPSFASSLGLFLVAGAILGSGLGGVNVSDRVFLVRLAPAGRIGEFFGLYGLAGKASALTGQLLYGAIVFALLAPLGDGAYAIGILSLFVTMVAGAWLLRPVSDRWHDAPVDVLDEPGPPGLPERLVPMSEPLEPRDAGTGTGREG